MELKSKLSGGILSLLLLISFYSFGQEIGYETQMDNPGSPMKSGFYQGVQIPVGGVPDNTHHWMHLIVARHSNLSNHYALQIASSYGEDGRLFFRKIAGDGLFTLNPAWIELATRGTNTFNGGQIINPSGKGGIHIGNPNSGTDGFTSLGLGISSERHGYAYIQAIKSAGSAYGNVVLNHEGGNVLIGKTDQTNASYKLDVAGKVRANEIIVNTNGADFVFEPDYQLRSLPDVERFVKEHRHLPDIPSAAIMQSQGAAVGEVQTLLLQKVEELTLYIIEQNKLLQQHQRQLQQLENENQNLKKKLM